jgi:hypothetical protein
MLGIYLLVCMAVYFLIELKAYSLVKGGELSVVLSAEPRTYEVCRRVSMFVVVLQVVIFLGYAGCAWPYLFIEGIGPTAYLFGIALFGLYPVLFIAFLCYMIIKNTQGYIKISTDGIEYKRHKSFTFKVSDIKKIVYLGMDKYLICFKEKGKKTLLVSLYGVYKKKEIGLLMKQFRDYVAEASGQERSLAYRLSSWAYIMIIYAYCPAFFRIAIFLLLVYTSYCCIDYDFVRQDYTERYNALNADAGQSENAWPYYVQAAANCVELEENLQKMIETSFDPDPLDFTDSQKEEFKSWFSKNSASWASLQKAVSIDYCNAVYEQISLMKNSKRGDFSNPSDGGYAQIRDLYGNAYAGSRARVLDLDWFELLQMQLASSSHFVNGKSFIDQLVGYAMVRKTVNMLAGQENYKLEDLQKVRTSLKECFPAGVPLLSIEGEVLIICSSYDDMIKLIKIPIQTPLNPVFLILGSSTGTEAYVRQHYTSVLEQVRGGIEVKSKRFSIADFQIMRWISLSIHDSSIAGVYKYSQRAKTNLAAAYFLLDLEEYKLRKGGYPANVSQLKEAGFQGEFPDDIDSGGKIIYRNDGQRAVLYAVGYNAIDDGGYKDQRGSEKGRDDIIYWQRDVKNQMNNDK